MILFALTSDIKQSTDYADLDSLLYGISNGDKKCLEQLYQVTHTSVYSFALSVLKTTTMQRMFSMTVTLLYGMEQKAMFPGETDGMDYNHCKKSVFAADEGAQESGMYIAGRLGTCYPGY